MTASGEEKPIRKSNKTLRNSEKRTKKPVITFIDPHHLKNTEIVSLQES